MADGKAAAKSLGKHLLMLFLMIIAAVVISLVGWALVAIHFPTTIVLIALLVSLLLILFWAVRTLMVIYLLVFNPKKAAAWGDEIGR